MYGLLLDGSRIHKIVNGTDDGERRQFKTQKRGRIALVDKVTRFAICFVELYDVKGISYREFVEQSEETVITADMWATHRPYYKMCFRSVERITPIDVSGFGDDGVWAELPDDLGKRRQKSLFEF